MIDWSLIGEATNWYKANGYRYIDVPWWCSSQAHRVTCPAEFAVYHAGMAEEDDAFFVGSAEQALLHMAIKGELEPGKYVATTPCFRAEPVITDTHKRVFMKVELMNYGSKAYKELMNDAETFMERYSHDIKRVETDIGFDLELNGIEVGSYGWREHPLVPEPWSYGTGVAEPRFSYAARKDD